MPKIKQIKNPQKIFAVAYKIFTSLGETPTHSAAYAQMFSINVRVVQYIVTLMGQLGCIATKRGGGKDSGIRRLPGVTVKDLFEKFKVPYREGVEFENNPDNYKKKLEIVKEKYFGIKQAPSTLNEEVEEPTATQEVKYLEPQIANYAKAISRTIKK